MKDMYGINIELGCPLLGDINIDNEWIVQHNDSSVAKKDVIVDKSIMQQINHKLLLKNWIETKI